MPLKVSHRTTGLVLLMLSPFPFFGLYLMFWGMISISFTRDAAMSEGWRVVAKCWALAAGTMAAQFLAIAAAARGAPDAATRIALCSARRWSLVGIAMVTVVMAAVAAALATGVCWRLARPQHAYIARGLVGTAMVYVVLLCYLPVFISHLELARACQAAGRACRSPAAESLAGNVVWLQWVLLGLLFLAFGLPLAPELLDSEFLRFGAGAAAAIAFLLAWAWVLLYAGRLLTTGTAVIRHAGRVQPHEPQPQKTP